MGDLFAPPVPVHPHPAAECSLEWRGDHKGKTPCYRGALFSHCRKYRAALWRVWDPQKPFVQFVCLNPSTATEIEDDPTVRRVMGFARSWGFGGVCMTNLFGYRATDPDDMKAQAHPVDPEGSQGWNDSIIMRIAAHAQFVVLAYGTHGTHNGRADAFARVLSEASASQRRDFDIRALAINEGGTPGHPLYLPAYSEPTPYPKSD